MRPTKALLLAAGLGTRLRPLTDRVPKCLVPIAGRPLLDYWLMALADAGVRQVMINTHHLRSQVGDHIARVNARGGQRITEAFEPRLLGSAGTVTRNRALADDCDELLLVYADNFSDVDLRAMVAYHRSHGDPVTMLLFRASDPRACGIVELDGGKRVIDFTEKPEHPKSNLANAGVYVISAEAFREMADANGSDLGRDVLGRFVGRMRGWVNDGYHIDIGTPEALARAAVDARRVNTGRLIDPDGLRQAVFVDRDGVLIEHVHYISDPDDVRLIGGAADAVVACRRAGYACVVVSNQSAIGRGLMTEAQLRAVNERMCDLFAARGAVFDALYHCPTAPACEDPAVVEHEDRKPGPGMLLRGSSELKLDLARSWMVGDAISDVLAGINAGCRGSILVSSGREAGDVTRLEGLPYQTAADLAAAAAAIAEATALVGQGSA
jgi:mannose-1-phosphate guanylyltransferase